MDRSLIARPERLLSEPFISQPAIFGVPALPAAVANTARPSVLSPSPLRVVVNEQSLVWLVSERSLLICLQQS